MARQRSHSAGTLARGSECISINGNAVIYRNQRPPGHTRGVWATVPDGLSSVFAETRRGNFHNAGIFAEILPKLRVARWRRGLSRGPQTAGRLFRRLRSWPHAGLRSVPSVTCNRNYGSHSVGSAGVGGDRPDRDRSLRYAQRTDQLCWSAAPL
jgi:hypothetical protein